MSTWLNRGASGGLAGPWLEKSTRSQSTYLRSLRVQASGAGSTYRGRAPFSEPETLNIKWLIDHRRNVRWLIDLHSYSQTILCDWGIDESQTGDTTKSFRNPAWDRKRGLAGDQYREYRPRTDKEEAIALARGISDAIVAVRGRRYRPVPSFNMYAVSGTLDDYAYSLQWQVPGRPRILSFVIEHGESMHPTWSAMQGVIEEVSAGLLAFCLAVS